MARRGAPLGNRNRVTHGLRTREMKEMRAMVRACIAEMKLAAALVKAEAAQIRNFPPLLCGGGAERSEAKGVAAMKLGLLCLRRPFRQSLRDCHLPRKAGEENKKARREPGFFVFG